MTVTRAYAAEITKAERDANGDLIVYGKATGPDVDLDAQICDPKWLKSAMPSWMEWGNLREMHQPIAAGVGLELAAEGDSWMLRSKVVDDGTAKKIEAGALKGYSVGIKNAKVVKDVEASGGRIIGGEIVEVSYVDRPCNPTATLAIAKSAGSGLEAVELDLATAEVVDETGEDDDLSAEDRAKAVTVLDKAVGPDGEIDETPDIEGGRETIALLARLIKAEADELAAGQLDESCDISLLVRAVELVKCWLAREQASDSGTDDDAMGQVAYVSLCAQALTDEALASLKTLLPAIEKRTFTADERRNAADSGAAMKDGSFPIKTKADLKNAIRLAGHAKDPAAAKAHIKQRAKALGASDMIPDDWKSAEPVTIKIDSGTWDEAELVDIIRKHVAAGSGGTKTTGTEQVSKDDLTQVVKEAVAEATKAQKGELEALRAELAKVKATPIPGGPVITAPRPAQQATTASKAAEYDRLADQVQDPVAANGYRQLAAQARAAEQH